MNAAKTSIEKGRKNGVVFGIGVSATVVLQAYLAVHIAKILSRSPEIIEILMQVALVIFGSLAAFFLIKGKAGFVLPKYKNTVYINITIGSHFGIIDIVGSVLNNKCDLQNWIGHKDILHR